MTLVAINQLMLALLPELVLTAASLIVLLVVAWRHQSEADHRLASILTMLGLAAAAGALGWLWLARPLAPTPGSMVALDGFRFAASMLILSMAAGATGLSFRFLRRQRLIAPEYYVLLLLATTGMLLLVGAADLIMVFLGLELMSIAVYVLAGFDRFRRSSAEAALKYFLIGAFASGFLLYGIALVWGATGSTNLVEVGQRLASQPSSIMAQLGLGLLLVGFAFKVAAVPFHMWAPDVYDGAPTTVTALMATGVKAAAFASLVRVLGEGFPALQGLWQPVIGTLAIATILVGNIVALAQHSLKRMLAYSSVAHAGYLLVGVWTGSTAGSEAVLLYLVAYCLTTLASFGVLASIEHIGARTVLIDDLEGLFLVRPWAALSMSVCLISLLGFPGTFGFIGKWYLITAAVQQGQILLPVVLVIGSAISAGYYLPVIMAMTMKPARSTDAHRQVLFSRSAKLIVATAVGLVLLFGVWPNAMLDLARASAKVVTIPPAAMSGR